jgi:hypothetical protein
LALNFWRVKTPPMSSGSSRPQENPGQDCCQHSGHYSGLGMYSKDSRTLRCILVCDDCGEEMKEISSLDYAPDPVFGAT